MMIWKNNSMGLKKGIIKNFYNMLQENRERTPPWVDTFIGDKKKSAYFQDQIFKQLYLPQHLTAMISIARPTWSDIAMLALR